MFFCNLIRTMQAQSIKTITNPQKLNQKGILKNKKPEKGKRKNNEPRPPSFRGSGNLGGNTRSHLRKKLPLSTPSVGHESLSIGIFLREVKDEIWVVDVGHPMVRIVPSAAMSSDFEWEFLRERGVNGRVCEVEFARTVCGEGEDRNGGKGGFEEFGG